VENQRLGERLQMLEASIEEKARLVEAAVDEVAALRKDNRALEKKLAKLPVKRSNRGSSQEALAQLQQRVEQQRARTAELVEGFRKRLAAKQARVQVYRDEAEQCVLGVVVVVVVVTTIGTAAVAAPDAAAAASANVPPRWRFSRACSAAADVTHHSQVPQADEHAAGPASSGTGRPPRGERGAAAQAAGAAVKRAN
jgi:hypothetical protein